MCDECFKNLPFHEKVCDKCGCEISKYEFVCDRCKNNQKIWNFKKALSAFSYESPIVELVLDIKYGSIGDVAKITAPILAAVMQYFKIHADVLIPVPLAPKRLKERGYNQALLIAKELSKIIHVPVVDDFLIRTRYTAAQKKMTLKERQENLRGAFEIKPPYSVIKGKRVLIIDDVFTTGTTVNDCARVMKKCKPKSIEVLTVAGVSQKVTAEQ
jgi:ComF family protein